MNPEEASMTSMIAPVANIQLPTTSRVLSTSWCPDKDLVVVTSHASHQEKVILYKMQGSKKWEVTIQPQLLGKMEAEVVGVAWSPDGTSSSALCQSVPCLTHRSPEYRCRFKPIHGLNTFYSERQRATQVPHHAAFPQSIGRWDMVVSGREAGGRERTA